MFEFVTLVALVAIAGYPYAITATAVGYSKYTVEESPFHVNHQRKRRSPQLTGGGSEKAGHLKYDYQKNIFDNGKTQIDGKGSIQHNWQKGMPPRTDFSAGGTVRHNIFTNEKEDTNLDGTASFQHNWHSREPSSNDYGIGTRLNHNFYKDKNGRLDGYIEFDRQWPAVGRPTNQYSSGINYGY